MNGTAAPSDRPASQTAEMVLAFRARAHTRWPSLCADGLASAFATSQGDRLADSFEQTFAEMTLWIALRTAYIDACVERALAEGWTQVVILGAGFDTRSHRFAGRGTRFFEVDAPASLAARLARWTAVDTSLPAAGVQVACDFERERITDCLRAAGFHNDRPSLLIWEGVSYYLPESVVQAALVEFAALLAQGGELVFDVLRPRMAAGRVDDAAAGSREALRAVGEPLRSGLGDPIATLVRAGFCWARVQRFDEVCLALTGQYDPAFHFKQQSLVRTRVRPPDLRL